MPRQWVDSWRTITCSPSSGHTRLSSKGTRCTPGRGNRTSQWCSPFSQHPTIATFTITKGQSSNSQTTFSTSSSITTPRIPIYFPTLWTFSPGLFLSSLKRSPKSSSTSSLEPKRRATKKSPRTTLSNSRKSKSWKNAPTSITNPQVLAKISPTKPTFQPTKSLKRSGTRCFSFPKWWKCKKY